LKDLKDTQTITNMALPEKNTSWHQGDFGPKSQNSNCNEVALPDLGVAANVVCKTALQLWISDLFGEMSPPIFSQ